MVKHRSLYLAIVLFVLTASAFAQVGRIEGVVRLPENEGFAAGASVVIHRGMQDSIFTSADSMGHFVFASVPTGTYMARAMLPGYLDGEGQTIVRENHTSNLTLTLRRQPTGVGRIEGLVWRPLNGGPGIGATVTIRRNGADVATTMSDDSGHFTFESVAIGDYSVQAELTGFVPGEAHVMVMDGRTSYLTVFLRNALTGIGQIDGVVRFPRGGGPAVGATVYLFNERHDTVSTVSGANGVFGFDSVQVGEYRLIALLPPYGPGEGVVFVANGNTSHVVLELRPAATDGGNVEGTVLNGDQTPANHAIVSLAGHGEHTFYRTETNVSGHFEIEHVAPGPYTITACVPMHGFASAQIDVVENQTTHVTLTLNDSTGGHHGGDSLTVVDLQGRAIVVQPDSVNHPRLLRYFLDVNNDGSPDYRLSFGPPWYDPQNGAHRPTNGAQITIHGGLLTYTDPAIIVVYEINGLFWRRPFQGHGGNGGGDHGRDGCTPDSVTRVELQGSALVRNGNGYHGERTLYGLDNDANNQPNYLLDFGRPDYDPQNGASRPANGDTIEIVGGQIYCPDAEIPVVLVYEINGLFWREPGDTLGLGPLSPDAVDEPIAVGQPLSYLTVRNYPNPFNPTTTISYSVPTSGEVTLAVYDLTGRKVQDLVNRVQQAGSYSVSFDGGALPSGIYFCRVSVGTQSFTSRMLLLK
jgi:hypothetical protein